MAWENDSLQLGSWALGLGEDLKTFGLLLHPERGLSARGLLLLLPDGMEVRGRPVGCFPSRSYLLFVKCQQYVGSCTNSLLLTEVTLQLPFGCVPGPLAGTRRYLILICISPYSKTDTECRAAYGQLLCLSFPTEIHKNPQPTWHSRRRDTTGS